MTLWVEKDDTMKKLQIQRDARLIIGKSGYWSIEWYCNDVRERRTFDLNRIKDLKRRRKEADRIVKYINRNPQGDLAQYEKGIEKGEHEQVEKTNADFLNYVNEYIALREGLRSYGTVKVYKTVRNALVQFAQDTWKREPRFSDFDARFTIRYEKWGYAKPRTWSVNYVSKHLDIIRQFLGEAKENEIELPKVAEKKMRVSKTEVDAIALTMQEVEAINRAKTETDVEKMVRDSFVVACLTGFRFSDLQQLHTATIQHVPMKDGETVLLLEVLTQKTGEKVLVPLHPLVREIIGRVGAWKVPCNQVFNRYIKKICKVAGLREKISIKENVGGKSRMSPYEKYKLVSAHTARRTFASIAYLEWELPIYSVMQMTGHRTERVFLQYVKARKVKNAVEVSRILGKM